MNYRTSVIGSCQFIENSKKLVDGIVLTVHYNPSQAVEEFGDEAGKDVLEALDDEKKSNDKFEFIYLIEPRKDKKRNLSSEVSSNMEWQEQVVNVKEKKIVFESGYPQFPYHIARWKRPANEKDGRGIGTEILPQIKYVNRMKEDFIDVANFHARPAWQRHESVEGVVKVIPGSMVTVRDMDTIKSLDAWTGNFPVVKDVLEMEREVIHRAFFKNAFNPIEDLTGDRRTTLEIRERIRGTWPKIGTPVARIWYELISPCVVRSVLLLMRNGEVEAPPPELTGANFSLEFISPFALELRSQQSKAFQEWAVIVGELEPMFPGSTDNVDSDDAIQRLGRTLGVNTEDMASEEQRTEKRDERARQLAQQEAVQMAQVAGQANSGLAKAPESGSPAEALAGV